MSFWTEFTEPNEVDAEFLEKHGWVYMHYTEAGVSYALIAEPNSKEKHWRIRSNRDTVFTPGVNTADFPFSKFSNIAGLIAYNKIKRIVE